MLEETGVSYDLRYVDMLKGEQKTPEFLAKNPMGKLPLLTDGDTVITESAAIGLYLADRYAAGKLAPALDDPRRGTYLRWSLFSPSVIEPGAMAKAGGWVFKAGSAGWGDHESMLRAMHHAVAAGDYLLGDTFSMADVIFGGTLRFMLQFNMIEASPAFTTYVERLSTRPAFQRADARNKSIAQEHGLGH
jgi:glutathione S-transferase